MKEDKERQGINAFKKSGDSSLLDNTCIEE
jgi:hypothetical protein